MHEPEDQGQGDGNGQHQPTQPTSEHSIQHAAAMPPTVLVTEMDNGALILQGRPDGPRVHLSRADALPLRRELAAALGSTERALSSGKRDDAR